ncbi:30S ribosomal protein S20 [bacterium]|nr:30S ribosomal protein S20 [bacterium]
MPITKTAKKQLKLNRANRMRNMHFKTLLKSAMKKARGAIEEGGDAEAAKAVLNHAVKLLHRSASKRIIKRQNASRRVSRLMLAYNRQFAPSPAAEGGEAEPSG